MRIGFGLGITGPQGLMGSQGIQGNTGTDGHTPQMYSGTSDPSTPHINGDLYLNIISGDLFQQISNSWGSSIGNIKGPQGIQGVTGTTGLTGAIGSPASVYFNGTLQSAPKIYTANVTTASDSTFTVNLSPAGFTSVYSVHADAITANGTLGNVVGTSLYTFNTTTVTGVAYVQSLAVLGVLGISLAGSGKTIVVTVIGK